MRILKYIATVIVAATAAVAVPTAGHAAPGWLSSTIAPGATQQGVAGNVPLGITYELGLSPMGATASAPCEIEITRTWWVQQPGGERQFHFVIKNIGTISCRAYIMLRELSPINSLWQMSTLVPGDTTIGGWSNVPDNKALSAGLVPAGAIGNQPCELEVTRRWDLTQAVGGAIRRDFRFEIKNIGNIACGGFVLLGSGTDNSPINGSLISVGQTHVFGWDVTSPADKSFIVGVDPGFPSLYSDCSFEITRLWYRQKVVNGALKRDIGGHILNNGAVGCGPQILIA